MVGFIDDHRRVYGVESICAVLPIAPSTYFRHKAQEADPTRRSARAQRDEELRAIIRIPATSSKRPQRLAGTWTNSRKPSRRYPWTALTR